MKNSKHIVQATKNTVQGFGIMVATMLLIFLVISVLIWKLVLGVILLGILLFAVIFVSEYNKLKD